MTPDELREKIEDGLSWSPYPRVKEIRDEVIDAVMPVLAERDAEIAELRSLLRARDENLHAEAEGWRDIVSAVCAQEAQAKAERDRWADSARASSVWLVAFSAGYPMGTRYAEIIERIEQDRADLAQLRERAVVPPEDVVSQIHDALNESPHLSDQEALAALGIVVNLIESWRPSTGDTAGTAEQWRQDEREIDGGFAGTEYPRLWPPRRAALPEGHAEVERA